MTGDETPGGSGPRPAKRVWLAGLTLALFIAASFVVVAPPERCPSITAGALRRSAQASVDWFVRNQKPDGTWLYLYDAGDDSAPSDYNVVRHTGAAMGLYRAASEGLPRALPSADRGTEWALDRLLERDGWAAVDWEGQVDTGATALLVAGLVLRREATGDTRYDDVLRRLGRFLVAQTEPSGAVLASYDPVRGAPAPASTPSTSPGRPTGLWRASTEPSRAKVGARPRTASAPTWRRRATRSRITGRRSPITGLPTACPRPWSSPNVAARRSPSTR